MNTGIGAADDPYNDSNYLDRFSVTGAFACALIIGTIIAFHQVQEGRRNVFKNLVLDSFKLTIFAFRSQTYGFRRKAPLQIHSDFSADYVAVMIVPTGVAATIGGYAGDALPSARLLSHVVDWLVTHPNVMNGASLYWPIENALYVEGYSLDAFATGAAGLRPVRKRAHKIGLLLDRGMEPKLRARHIQVANAAKATLGLDVGAVVHTPRPVGVSFGVSSESGASWGSVSDTEALLEGADELLNKHHCTAIAVVARFPEDDSYYSALFAQYRAGRGVDAIAGVESLISRVIAQKFSVPVAHAPAFLPTDEDILDMESVDPKACAEELGYTFLPCVLAYLHRAPIIEKLVSDKSQVSDSVLQAKHVDVVVTPYNALGGPAVLSFLAQGVLVIAVKDNQTTMKVDPAEIAWNIAETDRRIIVAKSYAEAAGFIVAHKAGILLESITSLVQPVPAYPRYPDE